MILLDTNVVSEAMKPEPDPQVRFWLDAQPDGALFLSSGTVAELLFGVRSLPAGRRQNVLAERIEVLLKQFSNRILPFDLAAARHFSDLAARAAGRGFPVPDAYIAAIAAANGFAVATRDASAFTAAGLRVIDPWTAPA